jgi:hypothetical protein
MAAKKGNTDDRAARSADASNEIQDRFERVQSKLRATLALLDASLDEAQDARVGDASMLLLDLGESIKTLEIQVLEQMRPEPRPEPILQRVA